jgi:hypothetical protein
MNCQNCASWERGNSFSGRFCKWPTYIWNIWVSSVHEYFGRKRREVFKFGRRRRKGIQTLNSTKHKWPLVVQEICNVNIRFNCGRSPPSYSSLRIAHSIPILPPTHWSQTMKGHEKLQIPSRKVGFWVSWKNPELNYILEGGGEGGGPPPREGFGKPGIRGEGLGRALRGAPFWGGQSTAGTEGLRHNMHGPQHCWLLHMTGTRKKKKKIINL